MTLRRSTGFALVAAATVCSGALWAQLPPGQGETTDDESTTTQLPHAEILDRIRVVNVTAGVPAPGDAFRQAAAIDVLAGAEKDRREGASLGQSLEHLPGVRTLETGNNVGVPVIRGLTGNRIRLLSNGIAVDSQQYGIRHQPNIDPFLSERIEVVRGASSILYGSDALGGSIDVRALPLDFSERSRENSGAAKLAWFENNSQADLGFRFGSRGESLSFSGGLVYRDGGDISTPREPNAFESGNRDDPAFTGDLDFTDYEQLNTQLGAAWRTSLGDYSLRYSGWRNEQNLLLPPAPRNRDPQGIGVDLANDEWQLGAGLRMSERWELHPSLTWQNNLRRANQGGRPRSELFDGDIELEFDQYTARLEARHEKFGLFDRGTLGFEARLKTQDSRGRTLLSPGGEVDALGLFAFEERRFGAVLLQAGLRHDWLEVTGDEARSAAETSFTGRSTNDYSVTTGSLGGVLDLSDHLVLAANVGRGFRAPTLFELFARGVHGGVAAVQLGNPDLQAEKSLNTDLALRWRSSRLVASATVFRNRIDDYVFLTDTGQQAPNGLPVFFHEQDDSVLKGIELSAYMLLKDNLDLSLAFDSLDTENRATGQELPLQPADQFRAELGWYPGPIGPISNPAFRLTVRHTWGRDAVSGEPFVQFNNNPVFGSADTDSYTVADLSFGFDVRSWTDSPLSMMIDIRNLTDTGYRDFLYTYKAYALNPGRDVRLTLRLPFHAD
ncbi:MAG: TonB-dependent receptor plug domain-containing protein [Wenzhouxiangella sp.]